MAQKGDSMAAKPVIVVTGPRTRLPTAWWATSFVLRVLGAEPLHRIPGSTEELDEHCQGVVIGGGDDIDATLYGAENHELAEYDPERDAFEVAVIEKALKKGIPLLGICRGAQLINVVHGGSLYGDIRGERHLTSNRRSILPSKTLRIENQSRLARIMDSHSSRESFRINSLHHQAVDRLGAGLQVVGRDLDDFVQAIESHGDQWITGVQWHPEYLPYLGAQRRIFAALISAARSYVA